jgi:Protein of Unknown function (DUF2784)
MKLYYVLACAVMALHALFIAWVIFGAALTSRRPLLRSLHIASLGWGLLVKVLPWSCPLTALEPAACTMASQPVQHSLGGTSQQTLWFRFLPACRML